MHTLVEVSESVMACVHTFSSVKHIKIRRQRIDKYVGIARIWRPASVVVDVTSTAVLPAEDAGMPAQAHIHTT